MVIMRGRNGGRVDPFKDCQRFYTPHFRDRLGQRHVPSGFIEDTLRRGARSRNGDEYKITYRGHHIILIKHTCRLTLVTVCRS